jgi:hypothetical protein
MFGSQIASTNRGEKLLSLLEVLVYWSRAVKHRFRGDLPFAEMFNRFFSSATFVLRSEAVDGCCM